MFALDVAQPIVAAGAPTDVVTEELAWSEPPTEIVAFVGVTVNARMFGGSAWTTSEPAPDLVGSPTEVATMVVCPAATVVTTPVAEIPATAGFVDDQITALEIPESAATEATNVIPV